jgi:hypothetical protein
MTDPLTGTEPKVEVGGKRAGERARCGPPCPGTSAASVLSAGVPPLAVAHSLSRMAFFTPHDDDPYPPVGQPVIRPFRGVRSGFRRKGAGPPRGACPARCPPVDFHPEEDGSGRTAPFLFPPGQAAETAPRGSAAEHLKNRVNGTRCRAVPRPPSEASDLSGVGRRNHGVRIARNPCPHDG